jgi:uncharacterized membrane protein
MANFHVLAGHDEVAIAPIIRKIGWSDLKVSLMRGVDDFREMPSHLVFLGLIYPVCGIVLAYMTSQSNALQLVFPLASGFALIGPFAAIGLYEMSRRRELGLDTSWKYALNVIRSPSIPSIAALGLLLVAIFIVWLGAAQGLYALLFGRAPHPSAGAFLQEILSTPRGWTLIVLGCLVGFCFALATLAISVVSFPLLLDRDVGAVAAVQTSVRTALANPAPIAAWGFIVAAALLIGSLPFFVGLALVVPILGHATWHLYRAAIARDPAQEHPTDWRETEGMSAADHASAHSFLFPWPKT